MSKGLDSECMRGEMTEATPAHETATSNNRLRHDPEKPNQNEAPPPLSKGSKELLNEIAREKREGKATKADDAVVPELLWEEHLFDDCPTPWVLEERTRLRWVIILLRARMLKWWNRRVARSFLAWVRREHPELEEAGGDELAVVRLDGGHYGWTSGDGGADTLGGILVYQRWWKNRTMLAHADLGPGADAVRRAAQSSWWNWDDGSRPFHWRWPRWYQHIIRDGLKVHFQGKKPTYRKAQRCLSDEDTRRKMVEKLRDVRDRRYITPSFVKSLTSVDPRLGLTESRLSPYPQSGLRTH
jgi:hypothetical protein